MDLDEMPEFMMQLDASHTLGLDVIAMSMPYSQEI